MKYSKDTQIRTDLHNQAKTLAEALPWIKEATGRTVVIKYGGSAMEDPELRAKVMSDIVLLKIIGVNPVLVHGGGKAINKAFAHYDIPVEFRNGFRVTTPQAMDVVRMVLVGEVNQNLVRDLNKHGNLAVGVSGSDGGTIVAEQLDPDYGRVGCITHVNVEYLNALIEKQYIPVVAGVALGADGGHYNINADVAAGAIAGAIGAHKFIALTDVDGVYQDYPDPNSLISKMTRDEAQALIESGSIDTGMFPKLHSCIEALDAGVPRAYIINGKTPHALLLELLTNTGVGTAIYGTREGYEASSHSLGEFASKLLVNQQ